MKKFFVVLVALLATVAMVTPVIAEDRLSLSGSMQVRGFGYDYEAGDAVEDSGAWNDQRLRIGGKLAVADGVSVNFRLDATESLENSSDAVAWGFNGGSAATQYGQRRADIQFDKAYLQFEKAGFTVAAGQMYFRQGMTGNMMDVVGAGFSVATGALKFQHVKVADRNEGAGSFDASGNSESSLSGVMYSLKTDAFTLTPMATYRFVAGDGDRVGLGVDFSTVLGPVNLKAALEVFDGENTAGTVDEEGQQLYVDASMKLSDALTLGGILLYATGNDTDTQVTSMNDAYNGVDYTFAGFSPFTYGFNTTDFVFDVNPYDIGRGVDADGDGNDDVANGLGITALSVYADTTFSDSLKGKFALAYAMNEEDKGAADADVTGMILNAGVAYTVTDNTTLTLSANYVDATVDAPGLGIDADVTAAQGIMGLYVKF